MLKKSLLTFYNRYHTKNDVYSKSIGRNNFTYFYFLRYFHRHYAGPINGSVLDVGCGVGSLSFYLDSIGMRVVGIDISSRAIAICQKVKKNIGLKHVVFKQAVLDSKKEKNDVLVCSEIIEHIEDDSAFTKMLAAKLKKGGYLFLSTPSKENVLYPLGYFAAFDEEVGHVRRYTKKGLQELLESHGFSVTAIYATEGILRNILFTSKLGFVIRFIRGPLVPLFHALDDVFVRLFGPCDYFVVARKK